jgi:outer membrane protein TolC
VVGVVNRADAIVAQYLVDRRDAEIARLRFEVGQLREQLVALTDTDPKEGPA